MEWVVTPSTWSYHVGHKTSSLKKDRHLRTIIKWFYQGFTDDKYYTYFKRPNLFLERGQHLPICIIAFHFKSLCQNKYYGKWKWNEQRVIISNIFKEVDHRRNVFLISLRDFFHIHIIIFVPNVWMQTSYLLIHIIELRTLIRIRCPLQN